MRTIAAGAVSVEMSGGSVTLGLVPGVATSSRPKNTGRFVEHGHVEGLSAIDRRMLSMLFDGIAHSTTTNFAQLAAYRRAHPFAFSKLLRLWKESVNADASRLRASGRLDLSDISSTGMRGEIADRLHDCESPDWQWVEVAGIALAANLDDVVIATAARRCDAGTWSRPVGASAVVWLTCVRSGKRSGIDVLRRLFSPLRPSSYPPAQYSSLGWPHPFARPRFIDDGATRLGD